MHHNLSLDIARARSEELRHVAARPDRLMALELQRAGRSRRRRWRTR